MINEALTSEVEGKTVSANSECGSCGNLESLKSCPVCNIRGSEAESIPAHPETPFPFGTKSVSQQETLSPAEVCDYLERFRTPTNPPLE